MKRALFELEPVLEFINSIARAQRVEWVEFKPLTTKVLLEGIHYNVEWFLLTHRSLVPISAWEQDRLIDFLPDANSEAVQEAKMLVAVGGYTTPEVYVELYLADNLPAIMREAIKLQKESLELSKRATEEWCMEKGEGTDE